MVSYFTDAVFFFLNRLSSSVMDRCSCHVCCCRMTQFNLLLDAALQCKDPDCGSLYSLLLSPFYCSHHSAAHIGCASVDHTGIEIKFPDAFLWRPVQSNTDFFSLFLILTLHFFVCLTTAWCLITGLAHGESCPSAWPTSVSCTGMSYLELWLVSPVSAASSRTMHISSALWTRWGLH